MHSRWAVTLTRRSFALVNWWATFCLRGPAFLEVFGSVERPILRIELRHRFGLRGVDCKTRRGERRLDPKRTTRRDFRGDGDAGLERRLAGRCDLLHDAHA